MKATVNKVEIQGYLGRDPEVRTFENGRSLMSMSVATTEVYKDKKGEWVTSTTWHHVVQWNASEEKVKEQIKKGVKVAIEGKLSNRRYTDKEGKTCYITEIVAQKVEPLEETASE